MSTSISSHPLTPTLDQIGYIFPREDSNYLLERIKECWSLNQTGVEELVVFSSQGSIEKRIPSDRIKKEDVDSLFLSVTRAEKVVEKQFELVDEMHDAFTKEADDDLPLHAMKLRRYKTELDVLGTLQATLEATIRIFKKFRGFIYPSKWVRDLPLPIPFDKKITLTKIQFPPHEEISIVGQIQPNGATRITFEGGTPSPLVTLFFQKCWTSSDSPTSEEVFSEKNETLPTTPSFVNRFIHVTMDQNPDSSTIIDGRLLVKKAILFILQIFQRERFYQLYISSLNLDHYEDLLTGGFVHVSSRFLKGQMVHPDLPYKTFRIGKVVPNRKKPDQISFIQWRVNTKNGKLIHQEAVVMLDPSEYMPLITFLNLNPILPPTDKPILPDYLFRNLASLKKSSS